MFATPIAKEQIKAADPPVKLPTKRTMLAVRPSYAGLAERARMLQKSSTGFPLDFRQTARQQLPDTALSAVNV
ncbi:MAG TPA: hypothetical protein VNO35_08585 [Steroidobacteraceae bacterium]|nr:hypothetical protein [Steroidobacteraceae bacterium]